MDFDKLVHQPTRLRILSHLYIRGETSFTDLKGELGLTEGNLSAHLRKLEDAGYAELEKTFENRKPKTTYQLTGEGEDALESHVEKLEEIIEGLEEASE
ncbi:transcriptional regulator [candidate division MSBL1 archaeon SCGC-AAA259E22]|uniref:Transcriptional regulator n=1 Tax=candidate division MSBL1 archaeon SCGC-AAA259E22 TaxID=1698265 RepID=A0A133UIU1_9EURY|nr:transcriptional regulator [candidate division MSBL1 archaeon SCGC-AAA259E22]